MSDFHPDEVVERFLSVEGWLPGFTKILLESAHTLVRQHNLFLMNLNSVINIDRTMANEA